jgi:predicted ATP-dependent endonuclease of OLD family
MRIDFVEIRNFRRLAAVKIDFSEETTLLVGANNSGKTSAITALRYFLIQRKFSVYDIPLALWARVDELGEVFEKAENEKPAHKWADLLPSLDIWLKVSENEIHHVAHLIPTLDWNPADGIGVRLQLEPENPDEFLRAYLKTKKAACDTLGTKDPNESHDSPAAEERAKGEQTEGEGACRKFALWPESLTAFLKKRMSSFLKVNAYLLDPSKRAVPKNGVAQSQELPDDAEPLDGNPFKGLIRIDEVHAHRGFSDYSGSGGDGDVFDQDEKSQKQLLTAQLREYYGKHLDPLTAPEPSDIRALRAIHEAETAFDERLKDCFKTPLCELEELGYPGVTNPRLTISTSLRPVEGLKHHSAVQYDVAPTDDGNSAPPYRLPEQCNGLGYQNLISMVFRLISFRDDWMRVGKAARIDEETGARLTSLPPLHLVLLEEPEAHLHVQVQQVFIRNAFDVLCNHPDLRGESPLSTQLVVSTHSGHIAHEVDFADMRYFRRHPARNSGETPTSTVVNLSEVFGTPDETAKFVSRYLLATHADLFFADGAIMVEGAAERMLVPHFIRNHYKDLRNCYVTLLEVGGSHAHRLRPLIEHLGLNTLIITDIDAVDKSTKKVRPKPGIHLITANNVLKEWHPRAEILDKLLDLKEGEKEKSYDDFFAIRVAYQTPLKVAIDKEDDPLVAFPRTFEDALALQNIEFFRNADGIGLVKKFRVAIERHKDVSELHDALLQALENANKAEFALDMLCFKDPALIQVPEYINKGLEWLENVLLQRQKEVLVTQTESAKVPEKGEK